MENLKVRNVITYKSSTTGDLNSPRSVRVELVNPKTGGPLQITDASGRTIQAHVNSSSMEIRHSVCALDCPDGNV